MNDIFDRLSPNLHQTGSSTITFLAWDQSSRISSTNNSTSPFSIESNILVMNIIPVNDSPFLSPSFITVNYTESSTSNIQLLADTNFSIVDVDSIFLRSANITLSSLQPELDLLQVFPPIPDRFIIKQLNSTLISIMVIIFV